MSENHKEECVNIRWLREFLGEVDNQALGHERCIGKTHDGQARSNNHPEQCPELKISLAPPWYECSARRSRVPRRGTGLGLFERSMCTALVSRRGESRSVCRTAGCGGVDLSLANEVMALDENGRSLSCPHILSMRPG
jgi:hypothetical protein